MKRYLRYVRYIAQWLFLEKLRGLDFTMRDLSLLKSSDGILHGYSKTDEAHAKAIFDALGVDKSKRLLDIGCGKGAFLREACKENFGKIAGLEYVQELADIAKKNFERLGLSKRVEIYQGDAREFEHYQDFNVFYFFNPFASEIMETVVSKIFKEKEHTVFWIILHNPVSASVVEKHGGKEINRLYDKVKSYETIIYEVNYEMNGKLHS